MTEEQERTAFEAWYEVQPNGRLDPWKVWKARAALSQPANPAPEAPTDEQLIGLAEKHHVWSKYGLEDAPKLLSFCRDVLALSQRNPASPAAPDEGLSQAGS